MNVTTYPSAVDYTLALQNPGAAFADAGLQKATFAQGLLGPYGIAGSSAVVFHATVDKGAKKEEYALRCYTRQDASTPERYAALDAFVAGNALSKYVGNVTWYKEQVQVKGAKWPVLTMGWIAGQQLNEYAGYLADTGNNAALRTLAQRWLDLVGELQRIKFAHGDLQHGNILVDEQGQLRLVDFDSVWIPPLQGQAAPSETGHPSYQPYVGTAQSRWGEYMDTFSALVIYLALSALAADPGLWAKFNNGDNLLFERDDFAPGERTDIWKQLARLGDPIDRLAVKLQDCCAPGWTASKTLQETLRASWWEQQAASPGTAAKPSPAAGTTAAPSTAGHSWVEAVSRGPVFIPNQAPPAGSLPPPPKVPYQSPVAQQHTGTLPVVGTAKPGGSGGPVGAGGPAGSGSWWAQQQPSQQPSSKPAATPSAPAKTTPAKQPATTGGTKIAAGGLLMVLAFIVAIALAVNHQVAGGVILGVTLFGVGIWLAGSGSKKPPAT